MIDVPSRQSALAPPAAVAGSTVWVVLYDVVDDMRFLAHHDEMKMLQRSLARAEWPVRFSQGHNPGPRVTIPLPRNLGVAALGQLALVELRPDADAANLGQRLAASLPRQVPLRHAGPLIGDHRPQPRGVEYCVTLEEADLSDLPATIQALLSKERLVIEREMGPDKPARQVEIRGFLRELIVRDGRLHMNLSVENQASARPAEVLAVLGLVSDWYKASAVRIRVEWDPPVAAKVNENKSALI